MKAKSLILVALIAFAAAGAYYYYGRPKPAPEKPAPDIVHHRNLAPPGTLFLLERVAITTPTGVTGFKPGTKVQIVKEVGDDKFLVTNGTTQFEVAGDKVTNDIDLGALAGKTDARSQAALGQVLAQIMKEEKARDEKEKKEYAQQQQQQQQARQDEQRRQVNRTVTVAQTPNVKKDVARQAKFHWVWPRNPWPQ